MHCFSRILLCLTLLTLVACRESKSLKVGFIGGLSQKSAYLGVPAKNAVELCLAEVNAEGGIDGRLLELVVVDDGNDPVMARRGIKRLIREEVEFIVGPLTSAMGVAVAPYANEAGVLLLSPTVSTDQLSGQDDYFFRIYPSSSFQGRQAAKKLFGIENIQFLGVVVDQDNKAYAEPYYESLRSIFVDEWGRELRRFDFHSSTEVSFYELAKEIEHSGVDALFVLANTMDTAFLCQQLYKRSYFIPLSGGEWAISDMLLALGGQAVEGFSSVNTVKIHCGASLCREFVENYQQRYAEAPSFSAYHAYDCTRIGVDGLRHKGEQSLKAYLLKAPYFEGVQGRIRFDSNGDVIRPMFGIQIINGQYQMLTGDDRE